MLMTTITGYRPEPGRLVEFRATAAADRVTGEPLSYLQENHVRRLLANRAAGRAQSPWLATVFDLPGEFRPDAMTAALEKWLERHPSLLTYFSLGDGGLRRHTVVPAGLETVAVGEVADIPGYLHERFDEGTDPLSWPPFVAGAIVREDSATVYYAVDHSHTDGYSVMLVFAELRALYEAEVTGIPAVLPEVGSYVDACVQERALAAELTLESPEARQWLDFWLSGPPPAFPLELDVEPGRFYSSAALDADVFDAAEAERFSRACKENGAGFSAGWLTALAITAYELAGVEQHRGLAVVHTRDEPRWQSAQGWFINLGPVAFPVAGREFGSVVAGAQAAFDRAQSLARVSLLRVAELLPGLDPQGDAAAVPPMVSYLDMRHAPGAREWASSNVTALVGPGQTADVSMWLNRLAERTYLKAQYPDTPAARTAVPRYVTHLVEVLREIARTGGYRLKHPAWL
ncbi:hypothetical protein FHX82_003507 [Amycolatopsis bartoniae]|uniref:Condensation domain-containing protein n=1 Tax=Amycolatopsis bartoniae TaxID=941986 RepID=A0A8H9J2N1_9PSEU|nr:condensation domain-containing protein [Amycolatopsis bartoniae]MBB2936443.1 hypothetical protein [Amycolatopsis bartoniae]TVT11070.1 hypothetical protein FNH07_03520 [Amycolatopsis bartoniae]GHF68917.1 hypothetical protein GCM10017566_48470 [Amycolatopsis bartoniae]